MTAACHLMMLVLGATPTGQEIHQGDVVCHVDVDRRELALSGVLSLTVSVEGPGTLEVEPPNPLTKSPDWRVAPGPVSVSTLPNGRLQWKQMFRLEPFQTGANVALPLEPIRYRTKNEIRERRFESPPLNFRVNSTVSNPDLSQIRGTPALESAPSSDSQSAAAWWLVGSAVAAVAVGGGMLSWRLLRSRPAAKPVPVGIRTLRRLQLLDESNQHPNDRFIKMSELLTEFLGGQFRLNAATRTTSEFLNQLGRADRLSAEHYASVFKLLQQADLIKYAGVNVPQASCAAASSTIRGLILSLVANKS